MDLDRAALQKRVHALYAREHAALGETGTLEHLERGRQWTLSQTLSDGGVLVFPHAGVADCGYQIAACVHAALDSGADKVIVLSVLHAFSAEMEAARVAVAKGADPAGSPFWGIQGPGIAGRNEWRGDHALISWRYFWKAEITRRRLPESKTPQVFERYPYLAGGRPGDLPGIDEVGAAGGRRRHRQHRRSLSSWHRLWRRARSGLCARRTRTGVRPLGH